MLPEEPEKVMGSDAEDRDKEGLEKDAADDADKHFQEKQVPGNAAPKDRLCQRAVQRDCIAFWMLVFIHSCTSFPSEQTENGSPAGTAFDDIDEIRREQASRDGKDEDDELLRTCAVIAGEHGNRSSCQAQNT